MNNIGNIICEGNDTPSESNIINNDKYRVKAKGRLQTAEELNRNNRCYSRKDLFPEVKGQRIQELIKHGQMKGESGHPIDANLVRQQTVLPHCSCVIYDQIWTEGDDILAIYQGTNNALGADFDMDLRQGRDPAFSLRALGTIEEKAGKAYVRNIKIITWDHVIYPSHRNAYNIGLVTESANMYSRPADGNDLTANNGKGLIIPITNESVINYIKTESANIKTIMNNFDVLYESITVKGNNVHLVDRFGNTIMVRLENYINDEIRRFASGK